MKDLAKAQLNVLTGIVTQTALCRCRAGGVPVWRFPGEEQGHSEWRTDQCAESQQGEEHKHIHIHIKLMYSRSKTEELCLFECINVRLKALWSVHWDQSPEACSSWRAVAPALLFTEGSVKQRPPLAMWRQCWCQQFRQQIQGQRGLRLYLYITDKA